MKFDKKILESFLWETHSIEKNLQTKEKINKGTPEDKIDLCHNLTLNNFFLLRRVRDPGFSQFVTEKIEDSPDIIEKTIVHIYRLSAKHVFSDDLFTPLVEEINEDPQINSELCHKIHFTDEIEELHDHILKETKVSLEYFDKRYEYAIKNGLHDETVVISSLLDDFKTGRFHGFKMFSSGENTEYVNEDARWYSESTKYFYENVKWPERYINLPIIDSDGNFKEFKMNGSPREYDSIFMRFLPYGVKATKYIAQRMGIPFILDYKPDNIEDFSRISKFSADALSIAAELWFSSFNETEKIEILNDNYEFNLTNEHIADFDFTMFGLSGQMFFLHGYFNEAKLVYAEGLKQSLCDEERYSFASNLATTYRELDDYQKALEYYQGCFKALCNIKYTGKRTQKGMQKSRIPIVKAENPLYRQAIELLNIAEMKIQTGDSIGGEEDIAVVRKDLRKLSHENQAHLVSKIACLRKRTHNYLAEYLSLKELRNYEGIAFSPELEERWLFLNLPKAFLPNLSNMFPGFWEEFKEHTFQQILQNEQNLENIRSVGNMQKAEEYMQRSESALNSFRFRASLEYCQEAISLDRNPHLLSEMAHLQMELGEYDNALAVLEEAINSTVDTNLCAKCMSFKALIDLDREDADSAIFQIETTIEYIIHSDLQDDEKKIIISKCLHQICKHLIKMDCDITSIDFSDRIVGFMTKRFSAWDVYNMLASVFMSVYATDVALHYIDVFLDSDDISQQERGNGFGARGNILKNCGKYDEALASFQESRNLYLELNPDVKDELYANICANIAYSYGMLSDPGNGLEYANIACEIMPDNQDYKEMQNKYVAFLNNKLSIQSIKDRETRIIFNTAEMLVFDFYDNIDGKTEIEFGPVSVQYAKGLEKILFVNVQPIISEEIIKEFNIETDKDIYQLPVAKVPYKKAFLPNPGDRESITAIQWSKMKDYSGIINKKILDILDERFGNEIFDTIFEACEAVSLLDRNGAAHIKVKTESDVMNKRKQIILPLNKLIQAFYKD